MLIVGCRSSSDGRFGEMHAGKGAAVTRTDGAMHPSREGLSCSGADSMVQQHAGWIRCSPSETALSWRSGWQQHGSEAAIAAPPQAKAAPACMLHAVTTAMAMATMLRTKLEPSTAYSGTSSAPALSAAQPLTNADPVSTGTAAGVPGRGVIADGVALTALLQAESSGSRPRSDHTMTVSGRKLDDPTPPLFFSFRSCSKVTIAKRNT